MTMLLSPPVMLCLGALSGLITMYIITNKYLKSVGISNLRIGKIEWIEGNSGKENEHN